MKQEFKAGIEKLGFYETKEDNYELQFGNQLLTVKKAKKEVYSSGGLKVIFKWESREHEDDDFDKLIRNIGDPNIGNIEYILNKATAFHYKGAPTSEIAEEVIRVAKKHFPSSSNEKESIVKTFKNLGDALKSITSKEEAERIEDLEVANEALSNKIAELEDNLKQQELNHKKGIEIIEFALRGAESNFSIMNSNFQKVWNRLRVLEKKSKL